MVNAHIGETFEQVTQIFAAKHLDFGIVRPHHGIFAHDFWHNSISFI